MNCIVCNKELVDLSADLSGTQPRDGTEFVGGGDYGSRVTDLQCTRFSINVCDDCIEKALKAGTCRRFKIQRSRPVRVYVEPIFDADGGSCPTTSDASKSATPKR